MRAFDVDVDVDLPAEVADLAVRIVVEIPVLHEEPESGTPQDARLTHMELRDGFSFLGFESECIKTVCSLRHQFLLSEVPGSVPLSFAIISCIVLIMSARCALEM